MSEEDPKLGAAKIRHVLSRMVSGWFLHTSDEVGPGTKDHQSLSVSVQRWFLRQSFALKCLILGGPKRWSDYITDRQLKDEHLQQYKRENGEPLPLAVAELIKKLHSRLGEPAAITDRAVAWNSDRVDVVVQTDQNWGTFVWLPYDPAMKLNAFAEVYSERRGRHTSTYVVPRLARGKAALKVKVYHDETAEYALGLVDSAMRAARK